MSFAPAPAPTLALRWEALSLNTLDALLEVEQRAYSHPWSRGNFIDALASGYHCPLLWADSHLLGYTIAMRGVQEAHLLNITVAPAHQGQGWARVLLDHLALWARSEQAQCLWLEVRASNARALAVYTAHGYRRVGLRKRYYPAADGAREDAIVMQLPLWP
ncbi:MAG: ribosomal protein S18-alanine N-acetyltransferase [Comamonadaceae bacterium]|jgi:ribosomal-protein-alanine N-acetyltransferase|nr:ribosomal protein S18-alanine N-acetyltransferase [Comamonadaceae bacterium]